MTARLEAITLESDSHAQTAFCQELHSKGYAIIRLPADALNEIAMLRASALSFFSLSEDDKQCVGEQDASLAAYAEGVGYRSRPQNDSEFLETFIRCESGKTVPSLGVVEGFNEATSQLHRRLTLVARTCLHAIEEHLHLPSTTLLAPLALHRGTLDCGEKDEVSTSLLRICHYGSLTAKVVQTEGEASQIPQVGFAHHTDSTLLTLSLLSPATPGLELRLNNEWLAVESLPGLTDLDVEVHAGDFLALLSCGYFHALPHRVVRPIHGVRTSFPLLLRPRPHWRQDRTRWLHMMQDEQSDEEEGEVHRHCDVTDHA